MDSGTAPDGADSPYTNGITPRRLRRYFPAITPNNSAIDNSTSARNQTSAPIFVPQISVNGSCSDIDGRGRPISPYSLPDFNSSSRSRSPSPSSDPRCLSPMLLVGRAAFTPTISVRKRSRQPSYKKEKIIVGVRVRPFIKEENRHNADSDQVAVSMKIESATATVDVKARPRSFAFEFDHGFSCFNGGIDSGQKAVYDQLVLPLITPMINGFNCSFFAYGQTGTGKTFSTFGTKDDPGVLPRFGKDLLEHIRANNGEETWKLEISYFEIYNENILDLLNVKGEKLRVREHPEDGPFVENLVSKPVTCYEDIEKYLRLGNGARHKASTSRNDGSSRSHAVFSFKLIQMTNMDDRPVLRKSKANFVDLAGSERLDGVSTSMANASRMTETKNINKSLAHLATVILQLADGKRTHISYRDSVLTWLLKDSLGGNAKTVMLATVSPSLAYVDETLSTLRYASTAYKIYNETYANEDPAIGLIEQLRAENEGLKALLSKHDSDRQLAILEDAIMPWKVKVEQLTSELRDKELELEHQKQIYDSKKFNTCDRSINTDSLAHLVSSDKPVLIALSSTLEFNGSNVYVLDSLSSIIGRSPNCTILLNGGSVLDVECSISWNGDGLFLHPRKGSVIYVNGRQIQCKPGDPKELFNGDRLILGANAEYCFSVYIPKSLKKGTELPTETIRSLYWQAMAELWETQYGRSVVEKEHLKEECWKRMKQDRQAMAEMLIQMKDEMQHTFRSIRTIEHNGDDQFGEGDLGD